MNLDGDERFFPNGGDNLGDTALGTFATAQVPEATSLRIVSRWDGGFTCACSLCALCVSEVSSALLRFRESLFM